MVTILSCVLAVFIFQEIDCSRIRILTCPQYCECDTWQSFNRVRCIDKKLTSIHAGIPDQVEILNLANNSISSLQNYEFKDLGLLSICDLYLQNNRISHIAIHAFAEMSLLRFLDLSRNHLHYILKEAFDDIQNLLELRLSGNRLGDSTLELHLPRLQVLDISNCHFGYLETNIFSGMPSLQEVNLSSNQLIGLNLDTVKPLHYLHRIDFSRNPWICNAKASELQIWLKSKNIEFSQVCPMIKTVEKFQRIMSVTEVNEIQENLENKQNDSDNTLDLLLDEETVVTISYNNRNLNYELSFNSIMNIFDNIPSYWLLIIGFLCGVSVTLFTMCVISSSQCLKFKICAFSSRQMVQNRRERILRMRQRRSVLIRSSNDGQLLDLVAVPMETTPPSYRHTRNSVTLPRYSEL